MKIIRICCTTFLLLRNVAHKIVRKTNGAILEFTLLPGTSELHKKFTGSTHVTFSVAFREGRCIPFYMQRWCTLCEFEIMRHKMFKTSRFIRKI